MNLNIRVDVYHHQCGSGDELQHIAKLLAATTLQLKTLTEGVSKMAGELQRLQTEVTEMNGVVDSAITLINGLAQQIRDLATDPAALNALADSLDGKANELAAAVVAGSPTPPAP